jgi:enoyl-[acyl-carrier-protein] reductase (NADH)
MTRPIINLNLNLDKMEIPMPPENMVAILLFLASDMSKAISGAVVPVDRAWSVL